MVSWTNVRKTALEQVTTNYFQTNIKKLVQMSLQKIESVLHLAMRKGLTCSLKSIQKVI